jgi:putative membrane protein
MSPHAHAEDWYLVALIVTALMYGYGLARLWWRAGSGHGTSMLGALLFASGWATLAITVLTPMHEIGRVVFSLHMVEHELLMAVATPLLVLARPMPVLLWAVGRKISRWLGAAASSRPIGPTWTFIGSPLPATVIHGAALWLWHLPAPFQRALAGEGIHALQHASFFLSALLFWNAVLSAAPRPSRALSSSMALFATSVHSSILGALLTFSPRLWYPGSADPYPICGLTRWEDQQLAGLVMWVPMGVIYLVAALWMIARSLSSARRMTS